VIGGNTQRRQTKTGGGDAGNMAVTLRQRRAIHSRTVRHQACFGVRFLPEVTEGSLLQIVDERIG
jgi:hypothetical protein